MTISYSSPAATNSLEPQQQKKNINTPLIGAIAGGGIGLYAGIKKNPNISKNGEVSDKFAQKAYAKYAESSETLKSTYNQALEILQKLKEIKTVEDLKNLLETNIEASKAFCTEIGHTMNDFIQSITKENLQDNKKTIKQQLESINKTKIQSMKNWIQSCWNKNSKTFENSNNLKQEVFDAIKDATKGTQVKQAAKYTAFGSIIGGALTLILSKVLAKNNNQENKTDIPQQ